MDSLKIEEVAINLKLLKRFHFYQLFDPAGVKIFGWNAHRSVFILFIIITQIIMIYADFGLIIDLDLANANSVLVISTHLENYICLAKQIVLLCNVNKIWDLFDVTRFNFLRSKLCRRHVKKLWGSRDQLIKITNVYFVFTSSVTTQWLIFPIILNTFLESENVNEDRLHNILQFRYPVSLRTYNEYYVMFYLLEFLVAAFMLFTAIMSDSILISICWTLSTQYEILTQGFKDIGYDESRLG